MPAAATLTVVTRVSAAAVTSRGCSAAAHLQVAAADRISVVTCRVSERENARARVLLAFRNLLSALAPLRLMVCLLSLLVCIPSLQ